MFPANLNRVLHAGFVALFGVSLFFGPLLSKNGSAYVILSSESGPLDGFEISGLNGSVQAGQNKSITVTAVDADGNTVTDYAGTIRFSSTDDSADLPNDYSFLPSDQGTHAFNLSVKFVTPGNQTLTVTDVEQYTIQEEVGVAVVLSDESTVDYGSDFVVDDFEREGDFTLISPASGTYSGDSIEVQGEADYGNSFIIYMNEKEVARGEVEFDDTFSASVPDLEDGSYELHVDIVTLGVGDPGKEPIVEVLETSDSENITIDTEAPDLISISSNPSKPIPVGAQVTLTVLSEKHLEDASILFEDELYTLNESASTAGKYTAAFSMPATEGEFGVDVILVDTLGNEVQYRDALTLSTSGDVATETETPSDGTLTMVTGITATPSVGGMILSWEAIESNPAVDHYKITYGPSPTALFAKTETNDASTTWTIPGLIGDQLYYFSIQAIDVEDNAGPKSNPVLGVPILGKTSFDGASIPDATPDPALSQASLPPASPETGPELILVFFISILGAMGYVLGREARS